MSKKLKSSDLRKTGRSFGNCKSPCQRWREDKLLEHYKSFEKIPRNKFARECSQIRMSSSWSYNSAYEIYRCWNGQQRWTDFTLTCQKDPATLWSAILTFYQKLGQPKLKGKLKHPVKLHVWAGIAKRGTAELIVFEGIMDVQFNVSEILTNWLLPFIRTTFLDSHASSRITTQTYQPSSQQLHGRTRNSLVEESTGIAQSQPDWTSFAQAKAFPLYKH